MLKCCRIILLSLLAPVLVCAGPVNINAADADTLARELKGIGPARANAIVLYRQQHGQFRSVDELALVKGIGKSVIERNRADLKLNADLKPNNTPAMNGHAAAPRVSAVTAKPAVAAKPAAR